MIPDEVVDRVGRRRMSTDEHPRIVGAARCFDRSAGGLDQLGSGAERQDRFGVSVLIHQELDGVTDIPERARRVFAVRNGDGVEEDRRHRLEGAFHVDGGSVGSVDLAEADADITRNGAFGGERVVQRLRAGAVDAVTDENRDAPSRDASVAGSREE